MAPREDAAAGCAANLVSGDYEGILGGKDFLSMSGKPSPGISERRSARERLSIVRLLRLATVMVDFPNALRMPSNASFSRCDLSESLVSKILMVVGV